MTVRPEPEPEPGRDEHPVPRDPPDQQARPGTDPLDVAAEPAGEKETGPAGETRTGEDIGTEERPEPDEPSG
ncbi:hypothetical protein ACFQ9Z_32130 [Streptomyces sp. NPDC056580]|uniref:hypothetical protein n=1 Tax=Streptomyces sp. NPDC056580 TaxID=3345872 RepID=UPI00367F816F